MDFSFLFEGQVNESPVLVLCFGDVSGFTAIGIAPCIHSHRAQLAVGIVRSVVALCCPALACCFACLSTKRVAARFPSRNFNFSLKIALLLLSHSTAFSLFLHGCRSPRSCPSVCSAASASCTSTAINRRPGSLRTARTARARRATIMQRRQLAVAAARQQLRIMSAIEQRRSRFRESRRLDDNFQMAAVAAFSFLDFALLAPVSG